MRIRIITFVGSFWDDLVFFPQSKDEVLLEEQRPRRNLEKIALVNLRAHMPCDPAPRICEWAPSYLSGDELQQQQGSLGSAKEVSYGCYLSQIRMAR